MKIITNLIKRHHAAYRMCLCDCAILSNRKFSTKPPDTGKVNTDTNSSSGVNSGNKKLNVMFFGTDNFALETLKRLDSGEMRLDSGENVNVINHLEVCCISKSGSAVSKYAEKNGLNLHIYPPQIHPGQFDVGVVASFGKLISSAVISKFERGLINVHGSLLPKLRGAAPIIHALKDGHTETGITIMKIKPKKFDIGDMLAQQRIDIPPDILRRDLTHQMAVIGGELLCDVIQNLDRYELEAVKQDDREATRAPVIDKSIGFLDFNSQTNVEIYNLWRSVHDLVKLRARWKPTNSSVRIGLIHPPSTLEKYQLDSSHPDCEPGRTVYLKPRKGEHFICVKCRGHGWLAVDRISFTNKKAMSPLEFANGFLKQSTDTMFIKDCDSDL